MEKTAFGRLCEYAGTDAGALSGLEITGVSTDSRTIRPGELFIALAGERVDGHDFIATAFYNGAAAAIVSRPVAEHYPHITVADTRKAYLDIASGYRRGFSPVVVGVTGSVGKTTTKEIIASVLSRRYFTLKNEGNLNNTIGLPATMLNLTHKHGAAVFEMGMSSFGEISALSRAARPDIALITNIGLSHIEFLGSREGIRKAKLEITDGLREGGKLILNGDEPLLWELRRTLSHDLIYFGIDNEECDLTAVNIRSEESMQSFTIRGMGRRLAAVMPSVGRHNVYNALAAAAAGLAARLEDDEITEGIRAFINTGMRQNIYNIKGFRIIEDCYNASPDSMRAALEVLALQTGGRRSAVLGGMLELGSYETQAHKDIGRQCAGAAELLFACGPQAKWYAEGAVQGGMDSGRIFLFESHEGMAEALADTLRTGDILLFKGSRGTHMENVLNRFKEICNNT